MPNITTILLLIIGYMAGIFSMSMLALVLVGRGGNDAD